MINWDKVFLYWNDTELGRHMLASDNVSNWELLFLIPNNKKKKLGLPLIRVAKKGRRTRQYKRDTMRRIYSFKLWDLIEEIIEDTLIDGWESGEFFTDFVEMKDLHLGDKYVAFYEDRRIKDGGFGCHIKTYNTKDDVKIKR